MPEILSSQELEAAYRLYRELYDTFTTVGTREPLTIPVSVIACREFLAQVLAQVSATHHTPEQADKAFRGLSHALARRVRHYTECLRRGRPLLWPGTDLEMPSQKTS